MRREKDKEITVATVLDKTTGECNQVENETYEEYFAVGAKIKICWMKEDIWDSGWHCGRFCIFQSQNLCILYVYRNTFTVIFNCPVVPFSFLNFNMKELGANCSKVNYLNPRFVKNCVTEFREYTQENWNFSS